MGEPEPIETEQQPAENKPNRSVGPLRKNFEAHARGARPGIAAPRHFGPLVFELNGQKYERQIGCAWYLRNGKAPRQSLRRIKDHRLIEALEAKYREQYPQAAT